MTTQQISFNEADRTMIPAGSARASEPRRREKAAGLLLTALLLAALLAAGWGVLSSLGNQDEVPARVGEAVEVPGGALSVDSVAPESMAPMKMGKFSANGMSMSGAGMDMAPEGTRRFTVEVTLAAADSGSLAYSAKDFQVSASGLEAVAPIRAQLEDGVLPAGSAVSGTLLFQVPEEAEGLMLDFEDGRPVALKPSSPDHHHMDHSQGHGHR